MVNEANLSHMLDDTCLFIAVKVNAKKTSYTIFNIEIKTLLLEEIKISINSCPGCGIEDAVVHIDMANGGPLVKQAWIMSTLGVTYFLKGLFQKKEEVLRALLESIKGSIKLKNTVFLEGYGKPHIVELTPSSIGSWM